MPTIAITACISNESRREYEVMIEDNVAMPFYQRAKIVSRHDVAE